MLRPQPHPSEPLQDQRYHHRMSGCRMRLGSRNRPASDLRGGGCTCSSRLPGEPYLHPHSSSLRSAELLRSLNTPSSPRQFFPLRMALQPWLGDVFLPYNTQMVYIHLSPWGVRNIENGRTPPTGGPQHVLCKAAHCCMLPLLKNLSNPTEEATGHDFIVMQILKIPAPQLAAGP